jgi:curved DNA-binding protein
VPLEAVYAGSSVRIGVNGKSLDVRVPKGIRPGQVIRLGGQGAHGDLLLEIEYAAHPQFEVDGHNILYSLPVAPWEAALGAKVSVPTLDGSVEMTIPAGAQGGQRLRLRGRGMNRRGGRRGDQYVKLKIVNPPRPGPKEKELFEKLGAESRFNPRDFMPGA